MLLDEKTFLINPFQLKQITDEAISEQINELALRFKDDTDIPYNIAYDIEIYANVLYLYGEMIARLTERHQILKLSNNKGELLETHKLRSEWSKTRSEKAPNISYFEALAVEKYELKRKEEFKLFSDLTRFKYAYESIEAKMNALKKKLEAVKFEVGLNG